MIIEKKGIGASSGLIFALTIILSSCGGNGGGGGGGGVFLSASQTYVPAPGVSSLRAFSSSVSPQQTDEPFRNVRMRLRADGTCSITADGQSIDVPEGTGCYEQYQIEANREMAKRTSGTIQFTSSASGVEQTRGVFDIAANTCTVNDDTPLTSSSVAACLSEVNNRINIASGSRPGSRQESGGLNLFFGSDGTTNQCQIGGMTISGVMDPYSCFERYTVQYNRRVFFDGVGNGQADALDDMASTYFTETWSLGISNNPDAGQQVMARYADNNFNDGTGRCRIDINSELLNFNSIQDSTTGIATCVERFSQNIEQWFFPDNPNPGSNNLITITSERRTGDDFTDTNDRYTLVSTFAIGAGTATCTVGGTGFAGGSGTFNPLDPRGTLYPLIVACSMQHSLTEIANVDVTNTIEATGGRDVTFDFDDEVCTIGGVVREYPTTLDRRFRLTQCVVYFEEELLRIRESFARPNQVRFLSTDAERVLSRETFSVSATTADVGDSIFGNADRGTAVVSSSVVSYTYYDASNSNAEETCELVSSVGEYSNIIASDLTACHATTAACQADFDGDGEVRLITTAGRSALACFEEAACTNNRLTVTLSYNEGQAQVGTACGSESISGDDPIDINVNVEHIAGLSAPVVNPRVHGFAGLVAEAQSCGHRGVRLVLSDDGAGVCSADFISIADERGYMLADIIQRIGKIRLGSAFGDALSGVSAGLTVFDALDRAFSADDPDNPYGSALRLSALSERSTQRLNLEERLNVMMYGAGERSLAYHNAWADDNMRAQVAYSLPGQTNGANDVLNAEQVRFVMTASSRLGSRLGRLQLHGMRGIHMGIKMGLSAFESSNAVVYGFLTNTTSFQSPYLGFASGGMAGGARYTLRDGQSFGFVFGEGAGLRDDGSLPYQDGRTASRSSRQAMAGMMEYAPHRNLMFHAGFLQENEAVLSSSGDGLFGLNEGSITTFVGMQGYQAFGSDWYGVMSGYMGRTNLASGAVGIVDGLDVVTSSFDIGVVRRGVFLGDDNVLMRFGQPMRVESGSLDVTYVTSRSGLGTHRFDVTPSGRTLEWGVGYGLSVSSALKARLALDYVLDRGHIRGGRDEMFAVMSLQGDF